MKKLYEVRATVVAYVLADSEKDARIEGTEAIDTEAIHVDWRDVDAAEVTHADWPLAKGWGRGSLVYGAEKDVSLRDALSALPQLGEHKNGNKDGAAKDSKEAPKGIGEAIHRVPPDSESSKSQGGKA